MKLIVLYGPPAAGKLTIANSIAAHSAYKVFDNHKVIDIIEPIVGRQNPGFRDLVYRTHIDILAVASEGDDKGVITTFPYAANEPDDVKFLNDLIASCVTKGALVYVIHLIATDHDLLSRVSEESRKHYGKIKDQNLMVQVIKENDFITDAVSTSLTVDTSALTVAESTQLILDHIG